MRKSAATRQVDPGRIDYINAHGTSDATNDLVETAAVKDVFGSCCAQDSESVRRNQ